MAKNSYNIKLKAYKRHTSPTNLEQVQTAYKEYTQLCTHVRNLSWNQWITKCNNNLNSAEVWRIIKEARGILPRPPTHHRPQEEADSLCNSFAQRYTPENIPERTNNIIINMVPERVRTITTASYEAVDTDHEFTLSELKDVLHRMKDTAPGDDQCLLFNDHEHTTSHQTHILPTNQPVIHRGETSHQMENGQDYPDPKERHNASSHVTTYHGLVQARVQWSAQPIKSFFLGFRSWSREDWSHRNTNTHGNPWGPCSRWHITQTNDYCTKESKYWNQD